MNDETNIIGLTHTEIGEEAERALDRKISQAEEDELCDYIRRNMDWEVGLSWYTVELLAKQWDTFND